MEVITQAIGCYYEKDLVLLTITIVNSPVANGRTFGVSPPQPSHRRLIVGSGAGGSNGVPGFRIPIAPTVLKSPSVIGVGPQTFTGEFLFAGGQANGLTLGYYTLGFGVGTVTSVSDNTTPTGYGISTGLSIPLPTRARDGVIRTGTRIKNKAVDIYRGLLR